MEQYIKRLNGLQPAAKRAAVMSWLFGWAVNLAVGVTRSSGKNLGAHLARVISLGTQVGAPYHVVAALALHDVPEYGGDSAKKLDRKVRDFADEMGEALAEVFPPTEGIDLEDLFAARVLQLVSLATETRGEGISWSTRKGQIEERVKSDHKDYAIMMAVLKTEGLMEAVGVLSDGLQLSSWSKGTREENIGHYGRLQKLFLEKGVPPTLIELYDFYFSRFCHLLEE